MSNSPSLRGYCANASTQNKHIGRNLHLHPTTFVGGVFEQETVPWEGEFLFPTFSLHS